MVVRIVLLCMFLFASDVTTMYSSRDIEGYPSGYLSDCPGSDNEAIITNKSLKFLTMEVQSPGNMFSAKRRKYTYFQMAELSKDPDIDFNKKTMMYVGGFLDSPRFVFAMSIGTLYKNLGYNVLLLDTNTFTTMDYPIASRFMRPVGKFVAKMLAELTNLGLDPKKLELVGLSLGGQTASFIAKNYQSLTGVKIGRLTGLDPAGPCFRNLGPEERIDETDAELVDIVSTNIDAFGMAAPVGHINFYVNGGEYQPGDLYWLYCTVLCSHIRSFTLWLSALQNPNSFIAIQCDSVQQARERKCYEREPRVTNVLGLNMDPNKRGIFYLATGHAYPYYLGPGNNTKAIILPATLKKLSIWVQTSGNLFTSKRRKYNYYQIGKLAQDPDLDFSKKTMLFAGGYMDSPNFPFAKNIGVYYKERGYNVLLLDTNWFSTTHYPIAARLMRPAGLHAAEMLAELTYLGLDPKKLELLGISLGGQTISFIAKNYRRITGVNIGTLTALDPSGPCFRHLGPDDRIDQTDGDFVQIIYTNIDGYGMAAPVGHVNFYVNGGEYQPGDIYWLLCNTLCSHIRSYTLWMAALENPHSFIAMQCDSVQQARDRDCYDNMPQVTNILGLNVDKSKSGIFFLNTQHSYPFYLGEKGLKRENDFVLSRLKKLNSPKVIKI